MDGCRIRGQAEANLSAGAQTQCCALVPAVRGPGACRNPLWCVSAVRYHTGQQRSDVTHNQGRCLSLTRVPYTWVHTHRILPPHTHTHINVCTWPHTAYSHIQPHRHIWAYSVDFISRSEGSGVVLSFWRDKNCSPFSSFSASKTKITLPQSDDLFMKCKWRPQG